MGKVHSSNAVRRVIMIGLDGLEPRLVEPLLARGELPHLADVAGAGGYARVATTWPPQTPVAWSTVATGVNPGSHGIFDFLRRNPASYLPELALNQYEQKNPFVPPRIVNRRRAEALWQVLSRAGRTSTVLRCPCSYPPDPLTGRLLSGMGVPDVRGSLGMSSFYSTQTDLAVGEGETVLPLCRDSAPTFATHLLGPLSPKTRKPVEFPIAFHLEPGAGKLRIQSGGQPAVLEVRQGQWSPWLKVPFKLGLFQTVHGMVRFYLVQTEPEVQLYASPVQYDPQRPLFPLSEPPHYAAELAAELGPFYTTGMPEDHQALVNGRIDETAFLEQCEQVRQEREKMLHFELNRFEEGFFFCLFDTPDRLHHLFWRFREPDHPANRLHASDLKADPIAEHYRCCDAMLGRLREAVDDQTLLIVLSDHGCSSFRRGVHLNRWLHAQGLLALRRGCTPATAGDLLRDVDWEHTRAYAIGLGGIYLNLRGREARGIVAPEEAGPLQAELARQLTGLQDPLAGRTAILRVVRRDEVYRGPYVEEAPDLLVGFNEGYRASWTTALGGMAEDCFEDNTRRWSGDHIIAPELVPGVLWMNRPFCSEQPRLLDLAPTVLQALGVPVPDTMEGKGLLR